MILACGCDSVWTGFFDRCGPCKERLSIEACDANKRERSRPEYARYTERPHWYVTYDLTGKKTFKENT